MPAKSPVAMSIKFAVPFKVLKTRVISKFNAIQKNKKTNTTSLLLPPPPPEVEDLLNVEEVVDDAKVIKKVPSGRIDAMERWTFEVMDWAAHAPSVVNIRATTSSNRRLIKSMRRIFREVRRPDLRPTCSKEGGPDDDKIIDVSGSSPVIVSVKVHGAPLQKTLKKSSSVSKIEEVVDTNSEVFVNIVLVQEAAESSVLTATVELLTVTSVEDSADISRTLVDSTPVVDWTDISSLLLPAIEYPVEAESTEEQLVNVESEAWVDIALNSDNTASPSPATDIQPTFSKVEISDVSTTMIDSPPVENAISEALPSSFAAESSIVEYSMESPAVGPLAVVNPDPDSEEDDTFDEGVREFVTPGAHAVALFEAGDEIFQAPETEVVQTSRTTTVAPPAASSDRPAKLTLGDFKAVKVLGAGAFGAVHLVKTKTGGRLRALKVMKLRSQQRGENDKDAAANVAIRFLFGVQEYLAHIRTQGAVGVVQLEGSFVDRNHFYFVLPFCPGGDLESLLESGPLPLERALFCAAEIIQGIDALHKRGIIHRDLKPGNVLIGSDGHLLIADLGLCHAFQRGFSCDVEDRVIGTVLPPYDTEADECLATNAMVGTRAYMAPEVYRSRTEFYSFAVDLYAFGHMLHELCLGYHLYDHLVTDGDYLRAYLEHGICIDEKECRELGIPDHVVELIVQCLQEDAYDRNTAESIMYHPTFCGLDWDSLREMEIPAEWVPSSEVTPGKCVEIVGDQPLLGDDLAFMDFVHPDFFEAPPTEPSPPAEPSAEDPACATEDVPEPWALPASLADVSLGSVMPAPRPAQTPFDGPACSLPLPTAQSTTPMSLPAVPIVAPAQGLGLTVPSVPLSMPTPRLAQVPFDGPACSLPLPVAQSTAEASLPRTPATAPMHGLGLHQPSTTTTEDTGPLNVPIDTTADHPSSSAANPLLHPSYLLFGATLSSGLPSYSSLTDSGSMESIDLGGSSTTSSEPSPLTTPEMSNTPSPQTSPSASTTSLSRAPRHVRDVVGVVWSRLSLAFSRR